MINLPQIIKVIVGVSMSILALQILGLNILGLIGLSMETPVLNLVKIKSLLSLVVLFGATRLAYDKM